MSIKDFLKEKIYVGLFALFSVSLINLFLIAIHCSIAIIILINVLCILPYGISIFIDFYRRKQFYDDIHLTLQSLDQKHLLTEIVNEPNFIDGQIFYNTLHEINRSTADTLHMYKNLQNEYKSYIEMWIHEVKTPLSAARLILDNNPNEISTSVIEELDNIERFVEQALFYARSTNPEKDYLIKEMALKDSIYRVIKKHSKAFIYQHIKINIENVDYHIYCDSKWLEFILDQIICNALKYTPSNTGMIHIYAKKYDQQIQLYIQDNGIGISNEDIKRIFDKGFTGKNGRSNEKATGIGLYLCKTLCKKLYLDIQVESTLHEGTCITITFPLNSKIILN